MTPEEKAFVKMISSMSESDKRALIDLMRQILQTRQDGKKSNGKPVK